MLTFDAPLMSYGGAAIDERRVGQEAPTLSQVTGLAANALGYDHSEFVLLQRLQSRLQMAVRVDRPGQRFIDFQTVDLGQEHLVGTGWTTRGVPEGRRGGESREGTRILRKEYWADAVHVVALRLFDPAEKPTLRDIEKAIDSPFRPLFLGRKSCVPSGRLVAGVIDASSLRDAIERWPFAAPVGRQVDRVDHLDAWWPAEEGVPSEGQESAVCDERDWANQVHVGERRWVRGRVDMRRGMRST